MEYIVIKLWYIEKHDVWVSYENEERYENEEAALKRAENWVINENEKIEVYVVDFSGKGTIIYEREGK